MRVPISTALLALCATLLNCPISCNAELELVDNGYVGLVITISEYVSEEHCNQVIYGLKNVLREFSSMLWSVTDARASLRDVTVALPTTWKTDEGTCTLLNPLTTSTSPGEAHIQVTSSHPVFGSRPWVHQTQGCGRQGDYIQIGDSLLRSVANNTYSYVARLLMAEWVKFRWGTFEEQGFPSDPLYPQHYRDPQTGIMKPNTCTNYQNPIIPLCPTSSHAPESPTKHNAQCRGRPAWDVVLQSQDFLNGRNSPSTTTSSLVPSLRFVQETAARMVLVVEDTAIMNLQQRWEFMRKAIRRVMVYDVPDGVHVAIVIFNSVAKTTAPLMKMESLSDVRQRVGSSLPRNPSTVQESYKCVLCGLQEALRILSSSSTETAGAKVVLVTTGNSMAPQRDVDEMLRLATVHQIKVDTIIYPQTEHRALVSASHGLESLVAATKGSSFTVMDEGVGKDSKLNMMVALMNALFSAMCSSLSSVASGTPVLIHSKSYPGGIAFIAEGSFIIDDSFGPTTRFLVFYYDLNHVGNTLQLTSPSGEVIDAINMQEDGDANVIFVSIPDTERGLWQYKVENRADSHQGLHVQVTGSESNVRKVRLRVWTNGQHALVNMTDPSSPVIVYAEMKDGVVPILNAKVTARLQRLGNDVSGSSYNSIVFDLYDHGFGDPDITGDDGVYSRYLPTMYGGAGYYQLSVTADDNNGYAYSPVNDAFIHHKNSDKEIKCCGSKIKYEHTKRVAPFQRSTVYGVLDVVSILPGSDIVPPNRILDLRVFVNLTTHDVFLYWTAPGDDYDWGRGHHYEAAMANSWSEAKAFDGESLQSMPIPARVGTQQEAVIRVDHYEKTLFVAVRAVDESGNQGGVSNIALVWVPQPPTTPIIITTPETLEPIKNQARPFEQEIMETVNEDGLSMQDFIIILGSTGGFLIFMIVGATICYCYVARHKYQDKESVESNPNILIKTNSTLDLDQEESQDSPENTFKEEVMVPKDIQSHSPVHEQKIAIAGEFYVEGPTHSKSLQNPFPDVTLTSTHFCTNGEPPATTHSHLAAYQTPYTIETCSNYPYPMQIAYPNEELTSYIPPGMPSISSQASASYTQEDMSKPYGFSYGMDPTAYQAELPFAKDQMPSYQLPPPMYDSYPNMTPFTNQAPPVAKVPPPVAPKPTPATRATSVLPSEVYVESKSCHATHV